MGNVQTASSMPPNRRNHDGTITVHCSVCGNSITDVDGRNKFFSAVCEICSREEKGELLSADIEAQLRTMRMPSGQRIPMSAINPPPQPDPMVGNAVVVGRPSYWFRVVKQMIAQAAPKKAKKNKVYVDPTAQEIANERRHKPLFEGGIEINLKENKK